MDTCTTAPQCSHNNETMRRITALLDGTILLPLASSLMLPGEHEASLPQYILLTYTAKYYQNTPPV